MIDRRKYIRQKPAPPESLYSTCQDGSPPSRRTQHTQTCRLLWERVYDINSPQAKLMHEWHEAFERKDIDLLRKPLHDDVRFATYPRSLNTPEQTRDEWCSQTAETIGLWTHMNRTVHSITEAPGKVILHYSGTLGTVMGVDLFREAIVIATIVAGDDGSLKIEKIEELIDSKVHLESMQGFEAAKTKE
ncbi:hypothetical protein BJ322DRAFT_831107 [Thelephora terrestris]|uniref:SnoaL-like domain-containing protein n=1 Tax=Thelephora terrestris TaxID=56493 RepID=A0A9P6L7C7_9AGAM|nr:hypothetical protein BJ322DRAFT_831107 [Thelephora terrestris]